MEWDFFISYASEDRSFAKALADGFHSQDVAVWFDETSLKVGDNLRESIKKGLQNCNYGIVILSKHFFSKKWPQRELDVLFAREEREEEGKNIILPIWHGVDADEVGKFAPFIADKKAIRSEDRTTLEIVKELTEAFTNKIRANESTYEEIQINESAYEEIQINDAYQNGEKELRLNIAKASHDEIGVSLATLNLKIAMLASSKTLSERDKKNLRGIQEITRNVVNIVRETSWLIDNRDGSLKTLVNEIEVLLTSMKERFNEVTLRFETSEDIPTYPISRNVMENIYYLAKEALSNALKYSDATMINVRMSIDHSFVNFSIIDNGLGFDPNLVTMSNGLLIMKKRAEELGGALKIISSPGEGTKILFTGSIADWGKI